MRLESVTIDALDPPALARFWSEALGGWAITEEDGGDEVNVAPPWSDGDDPLARYPELCIVRDPDPSAGRTRIHLDLATSSVEHQREWVDRLRGLGATWADVGQPEDAAFTVLADPEGNPFCVLDPRPEYGEPGSIASIVLAAHDAHALRDVYRVATGWDVVRDDADWITLQRPDGHGPLLEILTRPTMPAETAKNRIHLDMAPGPHDDQAEVVGRALEAGARAAQVGQSGDESWVVLADPEDNELCILRPRE